MNIYHLTILLLLLSYGDISFNSVNNACPKFYLYHFSDISNQCYENPDVLSDIWKITERHGYLLESHNVTTSDGYILNVYKVSKESTKSNKGTVLLMNGLIVSSTSWVDIGNRSLAFFLVDHGYEVWIGNWRGTKDSDKHISLTFDDPNYWDFSVDTLAKEDLRNQLKLVAEKSDNRKKIFYIGYSLGTTTAFMYASEFKEEAEELLQGMITLAPVVFLDGAPFVEAVKPLVFILIKFLELFKKIGVFLSVDSWHVALNSLCKSAPNFCKFIIDTIAGPTNKFQADDLLLLYSYFPERASIFVLKQFYQIEDTKLFQKFDYGPKINKKIYGSERPPTYDLGQIQNIPVRLIYGEADNFHHEKNINRLYNDIKSENKKKYRAPMNGNGKYNHIDFIYAEDLVENLYSMVLQILDSRFQENFSNLFVTTSKSSKETSFEH